MSSNVWRSTAQVVSIVERIDLFLVVTENTDSEQVQCPCLNSWTCQDPFHLWSGLVYVSGIELLI